MNWLVLVVVDGWSRVVGFRLEGWCWVGGAAGPEGRPDMLLLSWG